MKDIIIIGLGGFAKEIIWLAEECNRNVIGLLCESVDDVSTEFFGKPVLGIQSTWTDYPDCEFIVGVGSPAIRKLIVSELEEQGKPDYATLIHPSVKMSSTVSVGTGTMICAGCILTVDISIGQHCIFNLNSTVGHEVVIEDYVTVAPIVAMSGNVTIESLVEIGTGAMIRQGLTMHKGSMLGMGGVLTKNMPKYKLYAGNPAKLLKDMSPE